VKAQLTQLQKSITNALPEFPGQILPKDHPLIQRRDQLLADLVKARSNVLSTSGIGEHSTSPTLSEEGSHLSTFKTSEEASPSATESLVDGFETKIESI